jgi:hypothetical protein
MGIEESALAKKGASSSPRLLFCIPQPLHPSFSPISLRHSSETVRKYENFSTMDISYAEIGNVAWKSVVIFKQAIDPIREALRQASEFISDNCDVVSSKEILK